MQYLFKLAEEEKGFTLIELLIVIAIIAVLAGIVFVALNPGQRFSEARDAQRSSEVNSIAQALKQHQVDNNGQNISSIQNMSIGNSEMIGTCGGTSDLGCNNATVNGCVDITTTTDNGYLPEVPQDPNNSDSDESGYFLTKNSSSIKVGACNPEEESNISATR